MHELRRKDSHLGGASEAGGTETGGATAAGVDGDIAGGGDVMSGAVCANDTVLHTSNISAIDAAAIDFGPWRDVSEIVKLI